MGLYDLLGLVELWEAAVRDEGVGVEKSAENVSSLLG